MPETTLPQVTAHLPEGDAVSVDTLCLIAIAIAAWVIVIAGTNAI